MYINQLCFIFNNLNIFPNCYQVKFMKRSNYNGRTGANLNGEVRDPCGLAVHLTA